MVKESPGFEGKKSTIVYNPQWHKGVVGIVASRLVEAYYRPTIVLTQSNGFITGSARSITGFDLYTAIEHCSEYLEHFEHLHVGNPVDVCYSIAENYYRGIANIQLRVKDIKIREDLF